MITVDGEGALEQRIDAVSSDDNPGPSNAFPVTAIILYPRVSFENFVLVALDVFCLVRLAIGIQICNRSTLRQDVVVGFQGKLDALLLLVNVKM